MGFEVAHEELAAKKGMTRDELYEIFIKVWRPEKATHGVTVAKEFESASRPLGHTLRSQRKVQHREGGASPRSRLGIPRLPVIKGPPKPVDTSQLYKVFGMNTPAGRALMRAYPPPKEMSPRGGSVQATP